MRGTRAVQTTVLSKLVNIASGEARPPNLLEFSSGPSAVPVFGGNGIIGYSARANATGPLVIVGRVGEKCGVVHYHEGPAWITDNALYVREYGARILPRYLAYALSWANPSRLRNKGGQPLVTQGTLLRLSIPVPTLDRQRTIVEVMGGVDRYAANLRDVLGAKRQFKRAMAHRLFSDAIGHSPVARLSKHSVELTDRNEAGFGRDRVMGVIKGEGLVPVRDRVRTGDLARYKDVPPDAFAYNPMRINIGSIARNTSDRVCLVSPDYVVFQTDPESLLPAFLDQLRHTRLWQNHMERAGAGGVRIRIYFRDLAVIRVPIPPLEEQRRIVDLLASIDNEISMLERLADAYAKLRSALLDKLLSGEIPIPAS